MANDRALGGAISRRKHLGIIVYGLLLYFYSRITLEVTAFLAVVILLGILAWIGWTMATTPPPEPIAEAPQPPARGPCPREQDRLTAQAFAPRPGSP